jgi:hypothetical protein
MVNRGDRLGLSVDLSLALEWPLICLTEIVHHDQSALAHKFATRSAKSAYADWEIVGQ